MDGGKTELCCHSVKKRSCYDEKDNSDTIV